MHPTTDVDQLIQGTRAYEYADGLHEITIGLLFLAVSVTIVGLRSVGAVPEAGAIGAVILAAFIQVAAWSMTQIRLRFTWPRAGYVKFNRAFYRRFQVAILAVILAAELALIVFLTLAAGHPHRIAAMALFVLIWSVGQWKYMGQIRALGLGLSTPFVALVITVLSTTPDAAFLALSFYIGLYTLGSGIYALVRFLQTSMEPVE
jgi:hypothetical protein